MKRIFTHLFVAVLLMLGTTSWAQSATPYTVTPSQGSYNQTGWCSSWTSGPNVTYPQTTISVSGGINNMNASTNNAAGGFEFAVGQSSPSTWNFSVMGGYVIESYSFDFVSKTYGSDLTISAAGVESMTSSSSSKTWSVSGVNAQTASFQLSGGNNKIIVTNLKFTVRERQLEEGHVYRFVNRNTGRALNAYSESVVNAVTPVATSLQQQWYVTKEGDHFVLRNLYYAKYLKGAHVNKVVWSLTDDYSSDANKFTYVKSDTEYNSLETKGWTSYGFMHDDGNTYNGGTRVVSWDNENTSKSSHWTTYEVEYTADQLQTILNERPTAAEAIAKVSENFISLFNETACYTPKYSSLAEAQATAAYQALTDEMQQLVGKIYDKTYGSGWGEANADNTKEAWGAEYAKKFRVQMYEPYSIAGDITSWLGINSHANNDNPTGIYVHQAGKVYVMVEGEIKTGATLRLVDAGSNDRITNAATGGYALQQGLNVIEFTQAGGMLYICYNVDTYNPGGTDDATRFPHKLSEHAPLKIHIEGGAINGFYNACGDFRASAPGAADDLWYQYSGASVDKDADWEYMETRANLSVLPILGHRQILLFQLNDTNDSNGKSCPGMKSLLPQGVSVPTTPYNRTGSWSDYGMGCDPETGRINILLEAWDRVMYSELATMGLLSKSDIERMNDFYPRWTSERTAAEIYDYSENSSIDGKTLEQFCGVDYSDVFNHHGVALGTTSGYMYGGGDHCGYNINTFDGIIKAFASNAGSTWGPGHEIGHQHQALLTLNGLMEVTNNLFSNIALWYKGMSTSRYNGSEGSLEQVLKAFNTGDTYTNNIWALTHMYYRLWLYYHLAGNNTQFYPRLFELLRHDPMVRTYMQDGDVSMLHFYKLACQAAGEDLTEFFRAHGYFTVMENRLVGDYSNSVYNLSQQMIDKAIAEVKEMGYPENLSIIFINDDDEKANYLQHDGQTKREIYGETTSNSDFGSVTDFIAGKLATTPYTATLNSDGTITMSDGEGGVGFLILNDKGEIVSFSNKTTFELGEKAKLALISGKATIVSVSSDNNVAPVEAEVDLSVVKRTLLGDLIAEVETVIDNVDDTYKKVGCYKPTAVVDLAALLNSAKEVYAGGTAFEGIFEILHSEYKNVVNNPTSLIGVISGKRYAIKSRSGNDYMTVSGTGTNVVTTGNSTLPTTDDNLWIIETSGENYHIKHAGYGKYLQGVSDNNSVRYTVGSTAVDYKMTRIENGYYALSTAEHSTRYMNRHAADNIATWNSTDANSQWTITLADAVTEDVQNMAKLELLASQTRKLLDKIAYVDYIGDAYPLQADYSSEDYYITSNATENGHEPKYLLDNTTGTFFHTVWAGGSPGEAHYLQVDMGEENKIDQFVFSYSTIGQTNVDAPKTIEVKGSNNPDSGFQTIATLSGSLPETHLTSYTSDVLGAVGTKYRYLRFTVTYATGGTLGGYYYFGISELAIRRTNFKFNSINNGYDSVDEDVVIAAIQKYENARSAMTNGSGYTDALSSLQTAYDNLLAEYNEKILAARKETLAALVEATTPLIGQVGTLEFATLTPLKLTAKNLYCNEVRADDCASNGANADISATGYVTNLTDRNNDTFLHTNYDNDVAVNPPHYLRVDLGENSTVKNFSFNYVTRNNGNNCPTTIVVEGCNEADGTYTEIRTLTDGLPNGSSLSFDSGVITSSVAYRYIRIKVTGVEGGGATFFVMAEFGFSIMGENNISVKDRYAAVVSEDLLLSIYSVNEASKTMCESTVGLTMEMLDTQIAEQTAAKKNLEDAIASLTIDKSALQELYDLALPLYDRMADANGAVKADYAPSALTPEMLATAKSAIDAAKDKLENSNSQDEIDAAMGNLQRAYNALLVIENANVANTIDKSGLRTAIASAEELITEINANLGYYESVAGLGLDELNDALQNAQTILNRYYLTVPQYNETLAALNACLSVTEAVVNADCADRSGLADLIDDVNTLLSTIADGGENTLALPLQATNAGKAFYIKLSAVGDGNIANLLDKNSNGSAITSTYVGSAWGGTIADFTHYVQVDLGADCSLDELSFDYATRNGDYSTERPTAIKVLGSNDGNEFTEVTILTEGLAAGAGERSALLSVELGKHYRYVRFAVKSGVNSFHMSDFNLYATLSHTLKEYYTTAEGLDLVTLCFVLGEAKDAAAHYMTTEQYTAICNKLRGCYTTANDIVGNDYTERAELETLIGDAATLISDVATVTEVETPVLGTANVYCNADNSTNAAAGADDKRGVAALFDGDVNTFLHTTYGGNKQDDDLDHYIRIDMGEGKAVQVFEFNYIGRSSNSGNDPATILVQACNTVDGEWVTVETLTGLPTVGDRVEYASPLIDMDEAYRYVRFMVTETENNTTTTYNSIAHKFFVMSEFGFTAHDEITVKGEYADAIAGNVVRALYDEKNTASSAVGCYMTEAQYGTLLTGVQAAYAALNAALNAAIKAPLKELIDETMLLKNSLYEIAVTSYTATEVTLQCETEGNAGYLYCNAPELDSYWSSDNAGVAGCIDLTENGEPNLETFLHTEYYDGDQSSDGLDHYLRVDLGEGGATKYVEFGYVGRSGHVSKSPETVIIAATNDLTGEWTTIKTLTMAQPSATAETKTGALGNGVAYRYWRFMVTDTHFNGTDGNGHKYFALSDFNVYKCTNVEFNTTLKSEYTPNIYIHETNALVAEVGTAISAATTVYDDAAATAADCDNAIAALQPVKDKLAQAIEYYWTPVVLTTDETNPVLYTINAPGRSDVNNSKAWQYNAQNNNITIVNKDAANLYHLWYFVEGDEEHTVKIVPVMTPEYGLSATDFTNGAGKVSAVAENSVDWSFANAGSNWNFKPYGKTTYLSQFGGGNNALGFYGAADGGSFVSFTAVELENYAFARLAELSKAHVETIITGREFGCFAQETGDVYNEALTAAAELVASASAGDDEYVAAFTTLYNASSGLEIVLPEDGTVLCTVTNVAREGGKMFAGSETEPILCWDNNAVNAKYIFTFEPAGEKGKYYMKSLERGTYISTNLGHGGGAENIAADRDAAIVVTIANMSRSSRAVSITPVGGAMLHADASGNANKVVAWNNNEANNASAWLIDEVTDLSQVTHTVTMNATFSSVMLGYNATVPAGVEAYNSRGVKDGYVTLEKVAEENGVIPANTPVILYRTDDAPSKVFTYTTNPATSVPTETVLGGSLYQKFVLCDGDKDYYKLMIKDGVAKMYWMYKEFNAAGVSQGENNDGGHIKCSANKIYMALPAEQQAASYGMRFVGGEATDILDFTGEQREDVIYDLQGRKLTEITHPGFYMVNGKKVYVK